MAEPEEHNDQEDEAELRIRRARSAIGKSFEELIARGERGAGSSGAPSPDISVVRVEEDEADAPAAGSADDIAASVERRVSAWVDGRVRAAERRLELQSEAFEAALGEEAVGARRATEQVEAVRRSLAAAADQALSEVSAAVQAGREELSGEVRDRVDAALKEAELRVRSLGTAMQDEFRTSVAEANRKRIDEEVGAAVAGLRETAEAERKALHEDLTARLAEARAEMAADVQSRLDSEIGEALQQIEGEGRRTLAAASEAAGAAVAGEFESRVPQLEERIDRGADDQRAAIEARFAAAEATLRSRLEARFDEGADEQDRRLREEAAGHRKRINEELAAALQSTATELRRQLDAEREGARREFSAAAREELTAAVERLDELHSAAVRDAREAAEAVAASRLADARTDLAADVERTREENRAAIDRGLGGLGAELRGLFDSLRNEQSTAASETAGEVRRRADARIEQLGTELSERIEREVARKLVAAQADVERANSESADRSRAEARQSAEAAIAREVAKGEARMAAASERLDLIAAEKLDAGIADVEGRLLDRLATRHMEAQSLLEQRLTAVSGELSAGLAREASASAEAAADEARRRALSEIPVGVEKAVAAAVAGVRAELEESSVAAARSALAGETKVAGDELRQTMAVATAEQVQAIREETSKRSYRDHNRRAEAAATAQLARSLDALKAQRVALGDELAAVSRDEQSRREREIDSSLAIARRTLEERMTALRAETERAIEQRAAEAVAAEFDRRSGELERRIETVVAREEERASARIAGTAATASERLAAVDEAQQREERIRERTAAAERDAAERVREAEKRLVDVLGRIDRAEQRTG